MALRYAILGLLGEGPQTGYELHKRFDGSVGHFWQAKFQQVYGDLRRLEADGLVERREVRQRRRPAKKVYSLTTLGETTLDRWLDTPSPLAPIRDEFLVKVFSFGRLPRERAGARLREYRHRNEERLETYRTIEGRFAAAGLTPASVPDERLGSYLTLVRGIRYEENVLAWCDWALGVLEERAATARRGEGPPPRRAAATAPRGGRRRSPGRRRSK